MMSSAASFCTICRQGTRALTQRRAPALSICCGELEYQWHRQQPRSFVNNSGSGGGTYYQYCTASCPASMQSRKVTKATNIIPHHDRHQYFHKGPIALTSAIDFNGKENIQLQPSQTLLPSTAYDDGKRPYQITTPIYYVNDKPHVGHAYTSIACDVIARFMRLSGREVFFLSGTDEHGQKVEDSARSRGVDPQEYADEVSESFRHLLRVLHISNDAFIRTTEQHHKDAVQHFWNTLVEKGHIYLGNYEGWYSVRDECYYMESELVDGKAPTGSEVEFVVKEPSYFFKLSAFEDKLLELYNRHPDFIAPSSRRNEVISFVKGGLKDLSVSRTSFKWGIPVPNDNNHVMYVWIDALTNYLSALGFPNMDDGSKYQKFWPASLHVLGKDILRFHAVYWPAFLMAAEIPLPRRVFAHGWWTIGGEKMSKSVGNVIDPIELVEKYGVDATRFYLMADSTFGSDGDFSHEKMVFKVNANLANEVGNLCQRTLTLVFKNGGTIPSTIGTYTEEDTALLQSAKELQGKASTAIFDQSIHKYVEAVVSVVWEANQYIDRMEPWALRKTDKERMATVLYVIMEVLRRIAILYQPLIPSSANKILDQLSVSKEERTFAHLDTSSINFGAPIMKPKGIFPRFDVPTRKTDGELY